MSKMKKANSVLALIAVAAMAEASTVRQPTPEEEIDREVLEKLLQEKREKQAKNRGLKKFEVLGEVFYATNKKNALKKFNKNKMPYDYAKMDQVVSL